ncbi:hypothetical protein BU23DRAFT_565265 [Bimuria novae-zelandiae CBS 107.79]|uniref:Zn(2)-C6 fungal-type domain-containing protein n=1 Tax=Bimuria novae-zelandiae CBS 107.79 TaxID=1447943 RepID=A0A6A5VIQ6_9PLEO|nr:hypothetical protein BU23DRAFT_565265 [Bimuria novae-zelandiae CBS 107.79]
MFTTLRLRGSMEDLRCSGDRPACARCQSEGVNECTYPEKKAGSKPGSPTKRKAAAAFREGRSRKDSLSPRLGGKKKGGETWDRRGREREREREREMEAESVSSKALESPIHALASADESVNGESFPSALELEEQAMCKFTSIFEETPGMDMGIDGGELELELMLREGATGFSSLETDASDGVPALLHPYDTTSTPSDTYSLDLETYLTPSAPLYTPWSITTPPDLNLDFENTLLDEPSKPLPLPTSQPPPCCPCIQHALSAFSDAAPLPALIAPPALEAALATAKNMLTAYEAVLRCPRCSARSAATISALVVADELLSTLCRVRSALGEWTGAAGGRSSAKHEFSLERDLQMEVDKEFHMDLDGPVVVCGEDVGKRGIAVGAYAVESRREWAGVVDALVGVQLARLERVLVVVGARVDGVGGEGQVKGMIVRRLGERLREVVGR